MSLRVVDTGPRTFQEGPVPGDNLHNRDFKLPKYAAYGEILNPPLKTGSQNPKSQGSGRDVQKRWGGVTVRSNYLGTFNLEEPESALNRSTTFRPTASKRILSYRHKQIQ